jgi:DDE superfamily endonuclease
MAIGTLPHHSNQPITIQIYRCIFSEWTQVEPFQITLSRFVQSSLKFHWLFTSHTKEESGSQLKAWLFSQQSTMSLRYWSSYTLRPTQRPSRFQRLLCSGHKRHHGLKFQSVVTPDGLFASMFGPICGNRHDSYMLRESNILSALEEMMPIDGVVYSLYGDPAYPQSRLLFGGFRYPHPNSPEAAWNQQLSRVREAVEWNFKETIAQFRFLDHEPEMKVFKMPVGLYFFVATFLCNIHSVLYGNQAASYFDAEMMTFDEYLDMVPN